MNGRKQNTSDAVMNFLINKSTPIVSRYISQFFATKIDQKDAKDLLHFSQVTPLAYQAYGQTPLLRYLRLPQSVKDCLKATKEKCMLAAIHKYHEKIKHDTEEYKFTDYSQWYYKNAMDSWGAAKAGAQCGAIVFPFIGFITLFLTIRQEMVNDRSGKIRIILLGIFTTAIYMLTCMAISDTYCSRQRYNEWERMRQKRAQELSAELKALEPLHAAELLDAEDCPEKDTNICKHQSRKP